VPTGVPDRASGVTAAGGHLAEPAAGWRPSASRSALIEVLSWWVKVAFFPCRPPPIWKSPPRSPDGRCGAPAASARKSRAPAPPRGVAHAWGPAPAGLDGTAASGCRERGTLIPAPRPQSTTSSQCRRPIASPAARRAVGRAVRRSPSWRPRRRWSGRLDDHVTFASGDTGRSSMLPRRMRAPSPALRLATISISQTSPSATTAPAGGMAFDAGSK